MYQACIAIVDAARARLFVFERTREADGLHEQMEERRDLVNPARRLRTGELFSDDAGSARSGGLQYGFDDHRDDHVEELDARFVATVVAELDVLLDTTRAPRLILCAGPRTLGALRAAAATRLRHRDVAIEELPRDLARLDATELRARLADHGLLPPRVRFDPIAAERT